jgi:micrococcal nuclease
MRLISVFLLLVTTLFAETISGNVVKISDGDTITCLDSGNVQHKIRLYGIDAPEKAQAFGQKSKEFLANRIFNKIVDVEMTSKDRYGRSIGKVYYKGDYINLELVQNGQAWVYLAYCKDKEMIAAEGVAKELKKGLWSDSEKPVPPWEFRRKK